MKISDGKLSAEVKGSNLKVDIGCTPATGLYICATVINDLAKLAGISADSALAIVLQFLMLDAVPGVTEATSADPHAVQAIMGTLDGERRGD